MASTHMTFECRTSGLVVNPFLGASPDGVTLCGCCDEGIVEIKCPYSIKDHDPNTCRGKPKVLSIATWTMHHICNTQFCDFVVWTTKELFIQLIFRDKRFWEKLSPTLSEFYVTHTICQDV